MGARRDSQARAGIAELVKAGFGSSPQRREGWAQEEVWPLHKGLWGVAAEEWVPGWAGPWRAE